MNRITRPAILLVMIALFCTTGCRRIVDTFTGEKVLAVAGGQTLYLSDVEHIFTPEITPEDSLKLLESYVDMWAKKQLKIQQAEQLFKESEPDIERMVEDYRNSLLGMKLDAYHVEQKLDTTITQAQIAEYYNSNRTDFVLDRTIVRGRIVKVPDNYRQKTRLRELLRWDNEIHKQDFLGICQKNNFEFSDFHAWTDYSDFLLRLPAERSLNDDKMLGDNSVQEIKENKTTYYFIITDRRRKGDPLPQERAGDMIKRAIINARRAEIVRSYEDSLYRFAVKEKQIVINVE